MKIFGGFLLGTVLGCQSTPSGQVFVEEQVCQDITFTGTCVIDNAINRVLTGAFTTFDSSPLMTMEICRDWCNEQNGGYTMFGLENGNQCFCGSEFRYPLEIVNPGECHVPCPGDAAENCGGYLRMNLWSIQKSMSYSNGANFVVLDAEDDPAGRCYADDPNNRILQGYRYPYAIMTREYCLNVCAEADYKYWGVEDARDCYCGNELHPADPPLVPDQDDCNLPCTGNEDEICGGGSLLNLFLVNPPE